MPASCPNAARARRVLMRILSAADLAALADPAALIATIDAAMRRVSAGAAELPLRTVMPLGDGNALGIMPGALADPPAYGAKLLSLFPDNPRHGRSSHAGMMVLFDPATGPAARLHGRLPPHRHAHRRGKRGGDTGLGAGGCLGARHHRHRRAGACPSRRHPGGARAPPHPGLGPRPGEGRSLRGRASRGRGGGLDRGCLRRRRHRLHRHRRHAARSSRPGCCIPASI